MKKKNRQNMKQESTVASEEGLDPSSAFVHMASRNQGSGSPLQQHGGSVVQHGNSSYASSNRQEIECPPPVPQHVIRAQQLAHQGNISFGQHRFNDAVHLFTEAIKLDPQEVRFFGNRAFCFEILGEFGKALDDADTALSIQPSWPKGFYRRGCALEGLDRLEDAEKAFDQLLRLDKNCAEARTARLRVMVEQLVRLGFSKEQSQAVLLHYNSVKEASESLLRTRLSSSSTLSEIFDSEDEEAMQQTDCWSSSCSSRSSAAVKSSSPSISDQQQNIDPLLDPKNPLHCPTLWIGNLGSSTSEKLITTMFTRFGKVRSMQLMLDKHCAFVTYVEWKSAGDAMRQLQGLSHLNQKLLIKYPDRALETVKTVSSQPPPASLPSYREPTHSAHRGTVILRKTKK